MAKRRDLLGLHTGSGRVVYPRFQFVDGRPVEGLADVLAQRARGFGITGEVHTTTDYALTRRWASRLHEAGFPALHGKLRHDPALELAPYGPAVDPLGPLRLTHGDRRAPATGERHGIDLRRRARRGSSCDG